MDVEEESHICPYNSSIFELRYNYRQVFRDDRFDTAKLNKSLEEADSNKIYKVNYKINLMPMLGEYMIT